MYDLLFELIQVALGKRWDLSRIPSEQEWDSLFSLCKKQTVVGVAYEGLKVLAQKGIKPPKRLMLKWYGTAEKIKDRNILVNQRCLDITRIFADAGYRTCILKGQGNARMYPNVYSRNPGDIDIWVEGQRDQITKFVKDRTPNVFEQFHHIDFPIFADIPIEVHYTPGKKFRPRYDKRFQQFWQEQLGQQMTNQVELPEINGKVCVPTTFFNVVFQMAHMMNHFFTEGIGLRHFVDYYFVLHSLDDTIDKEELRKLFKELGLEKFAKGVMWLEKECLGQEDQFLVVEPNEKIGKAILDEMMEVGNFGQNDERYKINKKNVLARGWVNVRRLFKFVGVFPSESFWKVIMKIENQRWKLKNMV